MREKIPGLAHSVPTFRFVISIFVLLILAWSIGLWAVFRAVDQKAEANRETLCSLVGIFILQPRPDLTPDEQAERARIFTQIDDLIDCGFSDKTITQSLGGG